jgi:hypothetical protein
MYFETGETVLISSVRHLIEKHILPLHSFLPYHME